MKIEEQDKFWFPESCERSHPLLLRIYYCACFHLELTSGFDVWYVYLIVHTVRLHRRVVTCSPGANHSNQDRTRGCYRCQLRPDGASDSPVRDLADYGYGHILVDAIDAGWRFVRLAGWGCFWTVVRLPSHNLREKFWIRCTYQVACWCHTWLTTLPRPGKVVEIQSTRYLIRWALYWLPMDEGCAVPLFG
jgi:hypothetical protein